MASSRLLVPPVEDSAKKELWDETWKRVDRFLPDLRNDLATGEAGGEGAERATTIGTKDGSQLERTLAII